MDVLTKNQRKYNMSHIRSIKTKPELLIKDKLETIGFTYQPEEFGHPDFINKKKKIVVFVDGCFWHKCILHYVQPKTNKKFWIAKINKNVRRDKAVNLKFKKNGFKVIRLWEHDVMKKPEICIARIELNKPKRHILG